MKIFKFDRIKPACLTWILFSGWNICKNWRVSGAKSLIAHERRIVCWSAKLLSVTPLADKINTASAWLTLSKLIIKTG